MKMFILIKRRERYKRDEGLGNYHRITLGAVRSVTVAPVVQRLQHETCYTQVIKDQAEENRACLLTARRVYQLIPPRARPWHSSLSF